MIYRLIYSSKAADGMTDADLEDILETARTRNAENGITGMLLFTEGTFIQVLEGDKSAIDGLYARIARDPRHKAVELLFEQNDDSRALGQWQMAFSRMSPNAARKLGGNLDLSLIDQLADVSNEPAQIVQAFIKDLLQRMVIAAEQQAT